MVEGWGALESEAPLGEAAGVALLCPVLDAVIEVWDAPDIPTHPDELLELLGVQVHPVDGIVLCVVVGVVVENRHHISGGGVPPELVVIRPPLKVREEVDAPGAVHLFVLGTEAK